MCCPGIFHRPGGCCGCGPRPFGPGCGCGPRPHGPGFCGMPNPFAGRGCCGGGSFAHGLAAGLFGGGVGCCGSERAAWGSIVGGLLGGFGISNAINYNAGFANGFLTGQLF